MEQGSLSATKTTRYSDQKHLLAWTANGTQASLCVQVRIITCILRI